MTEEENIVFNKLKELSEFFDSKGLHTDNQVLVHLIEKLQKELDLKDKVIEEMIEYIEGCVIMEQCNFCNNEESHECNECIKQYFINKVKGEEK